MSYLFLKTTGLLDHFIVYNFNSSIINKQWQIFVIFV